MPKVTDPAVLAPLAERVLQLLSSPFRVDGHEIQVGCSMGLAVAPDNGSDIDALMRNADFALYRAKSEGRRTWRFFDPKMAEDLASRRTLEDGLRHALENDQFQLLYQPQIELATGRTIGYEAMLRWRLPGKGLVPASVFVSIAEETGLVVPIGEWVIRQVARDCALLPADCRVAINLSATQLKRDGIETFLAGNAEEPPGAAEPHRDRGQRDHPRPQRDDRLLPAGEDPRFRHPHRHGFLRRRHAQPRAALALLLRQDQGRPLLPA